MEVIYEGKDIYPEISVSSCIHEMFTEVRADTLDIELNNTEFLWNDWNPQEGDIIEVKESGATTGKMFITKAKPENALFVIKAISIPTESSQEPVNKAWESVKFLQIAEDIASKYGMDFKQYGVEDQFYEYLLQSGTPDLHFLAERCILESCSCLIFDGSLVIYSEPFLENMSPVGNIEIETKDSFRYKDDSGLDFSESIIQSGEYEGKFKDSTIAKSKILRPKRNIYVTSDTEAERYAKGLLRHANKGNRHGVIYESLMPEYAAGSVANIETYGESLWDGPAFIYKMRNDYVKRKSKLFIRKPLEGGY